MGYALITGASSGIGYELTKLFAKDGHNIILVARRHDRLEQLANDLKNKYKINPIILNKDLSDPNSAMEIYDSLKKNNIAIDYLVNNAGFIVYGAFSNIPWSAEY